MLEFDIPINQMVPWPSYKSNILMICPTQWSQRMLFKTKLNYIAVQVLRMCTFTCVEPQSTLDRICSTKQECESENGKRKRVSVGECVPHSFINGHLIKLTIKVEVYTFRISVHVVAAWFK